jgi:hypothetical protein
MNGRNKRNNKKLKSLRDPGVKLINQRQFKKQDV